jgi:hypothetical protein
MKKLGILENLKHSMKDEVSEWVSSGYMKKPAPHK